MDEFDYCRACGFSVMEFDCAEVRKPLVEALTDLFAMIEEGFLVRDTSRDASPDYFKQALQFTQRLAKCHDSLVKVK